MKKLIVIAGLMLVSVFASCEKYEDEIIYETDESNIEITDSMSSKNFAPYPTLNANLNIEGHYYVLDSLEVIWDRVNKNYVQVAYEKDFTEKEVNSLKEDIFNSPAFDGINVAHVKLRLRITKRTSGSNPPNSIAWLYLYDNDWNRVSTFYSRVNPTDDPNYPLRSKDWINSPHIHTDLVARTDYSVNGQFPNDFIGEPIIGEGGLKSFRVIDPNNIRIHAQSTEDMYNAIIECWSSPDSDKYKCRDLEWLGGFDWEFTNYNGSLLTTINYAEYTNAEDVGELIVQPTWDNTNPYGDDVYWEYYTFSYDNRYVFKLPQGKTFKVDGVEYYTDGDAGAKIYDLGNGVTLQQSTYWNNDPWDFIYEENYWEVTWYSAAYSQFWPNGNVVIDFSNISVIDIETGDVEIISDGPLNINLENNSNGPVISNLEFKATRHNLGQSHISGHDEHVIEVFMSADNLPANLDATAHFYFGDNAYDPGAYSGAATFVQVDGGYIAKYKYYDKTDDLDWIIKVNVFGQTYEVDLD